MPEDHVCPVCCAWTGNYYRIVGTYRIYKCSNCGLEHTHPLPTEEELKAFYANYSDIRANPGIVRLNAMRQIEMLAKYGIDTNSKILDFGAGKGEFVDAAKCDGVEILPSANERIKTTIDRKDYNCITLWGVLEHLPDPWKTICELRQHLKPKGIIAITTVNAEGVIPYYHKPPEHLTYWTKKAFEEIALDAGMEIIAYEPYEMYQLSSVYLDRLLSRTPHKYQSMIKNNMPDVVMVPTNEVFVVMK